MKSLIERRKKIDHKNSEYNIIFHLSDWAFFFYSFSVYAKKKLFKGLFRYVVFFVGNLSGNSVETKVLKRKKSKNMYKYLYICMKMYPHIILVNCKNFKLFFSFLHIHRIAVKWLLLLLLPTRRATNNNAFFDRRWKSKP